MDGPITIWFFEGQVAVAYQTRRHRNVGTLVAPQSGHGWAQIGDADKDHDDQLSSEEMQAIEGDRAERIRQADANEDGIVGREELKQALAPSPPE